MKRIKTLGLILMLSICLTGNIFASGPFVMGGVGTAPGLISFVVEHVLSVFARDCPLRICQNCRPNNETSNNGNGNCRPRDN